MRKGAYGGRGKGRKLFRSEGGDDEVEEFELLRRANW